jgi:hypothetical protein
VLEAAFRATSDDICFDKLNAADTGLHSMCGSHSPPGDPARSTLANRAIAARRAALPSEPVASLAAFLAALERAGMQHLPTTLDELAQAGVPAGLVVVLRELVAAGHDETNVVSAFLATLATLLSDGTLHARASRQLVRALRNHVGGVDGQRGLRDPVATAVRDALGVHHKAGVDL